MKEEANLPARTTDTSDAEHLRTAIRDLHQSLAQLGKLVLMQFECSITNSNKKISPPPAPRIERPVTLH